jgi:hypothetical protein
MRPKWCPSLCYVRRKPFTYLVWRLALSPNGSKRAFACPSSHRSIIGCIQNDFLSRWYVWHKPCTYLAPKLTLSPKRNKWNSKWPTSPRSSIGCVQNDFWAYGMFNANRAPILRQDTHYLQTNQNEISLWPHHRGVPSGASKMISEKLVCLAQTVHLSCTDTNTVSKQKVRVHMTHVT